MPRMITGGARRRALCLETPPPAGSLSAEHLAEQPEADEPTAAVLGDFQAHLLGLRKRVRRRVRRPFVAEPAVGKIILEARRSAAREDEHRQRRGADE